MNRPPRCVLYLGGRGSFSPWERVGVRAPRRSLRARSTLETPALSQGEKERVLLPAQHRL
jgi:hypothetical protein